MTAAVLDHLVALAKRLRVESADFLENPGDGQQWYNRGYAAGILSALRDNGYGAALDDECVDDPEQELSAHRIMAWGQAYEHGREKGYQETVEALNQYGLHTKPA